jgi:hypothetical protein
VICEPGLPLLLALEAQQVHVCRQNARCCPRCKCDWFNLNQIGMQPMNDVECKERRIQAGKRTTLLGPLVRSHWLNAEGRMSDLWHCLSPTVLRRSQISVNGLIWRASLPLVYILGSNATPKILGSKSPPNIQTLSCRLHMKLPTIGRTYTLTLLLPWQLRLREIYLLQSVSRYRRYITKFYCLSTTTRALLHRCLAP